ncbi:MAG: hypothetical protein ACXACK_10710 [Candidatus Hodarchaeales archaeon]|jgi:hypothetical protein
MSNPDELFDLGGLDELDTQMILYQMGVESFSPYARHGKVDMIIRSEDGENVRYADIKVCSGTRKKSKMVWELEIDFFMNNESFIILAVRLPDAEEEFSKHYFVLKSTDFLKLAKKQKLKVKRKNWILSVPFSDLQIINRKSKSKISSTLARNLKKYYDNWDILLNWINEP